MNDPDRSAPSEESPLILVIDDEAIVHASVGKILGRAGYRVEAVGSAMEGLERLRRGGYRLVITDLMMPQMNGIDLLRTMQIEGLHVPVVMITGYPTIRTALEAMRYGAGDYLAKPFTRKELLGPVKRALRQGPEPEPPDSLPEAPSPEAGPLRPEPGSLFFLPHHSWVRVQQDGAWLVGIESSFLQGAGRIVAILPPQPLDLLEQGAMGLRLVNAEAEEHAVAMPLTGQVMALNEEVLANPGALDAQAWLFKLLPSDPAELAQLRRRNR